MTKHRSILENSPLPQDFLDALQEFIGAYASSTFTLTILNPTTLRVPAATGNGQVSIAINGRWRYVTLNVDSAAPAGLAVGENPVFVAASDNSFASNATPPPREIDSTDYTFRLIVKPAGQTPSGTGVEALYRQVGVATWDGGKFVAIRQTVGGLLDLTTLNMTGTLANRPTATANNSGTSYFATDVNGGTSYRSTGSAWTQTSKGVTETATAVAHATTHGAAQADALAWTTIHGYGLLSARPVASASNNGYTYLATDVAGGSLYESNGAAWLPASAPSVIPNAHAASHLAAGTDALNWVTINGFGTLGARPVAAASNAGYRYVATDTAGGTLYESSGSAWFQIAASVNSQTDARTPIPHAGGHGAGQTDSIGWGSVHGRGTLASRPAAGPLNANYLFLAYDTGGGTMYHSDGASWVQVASNVNSQSDSRAPTGPAGGVLTGSYPNPAALAANVVAAAQIVDGSVGTAELADAAATAQKQADGTYPVVGTTVNHLRPNVNGKVGSLYIGGDAHTFEYNPTLGRWVSVAVWSGSGRWYAPVDNGSSADPLYMWIPWIAMWNSGFRPQVRFIGEVAASDASGDGSGRSNCPLQGYGYEASGGNDIAQFIFGPLQIAQWVTYGWSNFGDTGWYTIPAPGTGRSWLRIHVNATGNWFAGGTNYVNARVSAYVRWIDA